MADEEAKRYLQHLEARVRHLEGRFDNVGSAKKVSEVTDDPMGFFFIQDSGYADAEVFNYFQTLVPFLKRKGLAPLDVDAVYGGKVPYQPHVVLLLNPEAAIPDEQGLLEKYQKIMLPLLKAQKKIYVIALMRNTERILRNSGDIATYVFGYKISVNAMPSFAMHHGGETPAINSFSLSRKGDQTMIETVLDRISHLPRGVKPFE